jgi:predicted nucleotide-binding protein
LGVRTAGSSEPSSSNFRDLLSSSLKYGLTAGTEKAASIALTELGEQATGPDRVAASAALRRAAMTPNVFSKFYDDYNNSKVPGSEMLAKVLATTYDVPPALAEECGRLLITNGEYVGILRQISGSMHVLLDSAGEVVVASAASTSDSETREVEDTEDVMTEATTGSRDQEPLEQPIVPDTSRRPGAIFLGHGKNKGPLNKIEKILSGFKIPYKVAVEEPNLGRPIPVKVRETMMECGSAILIFTKDVQLRTEEGKEVWRPSENVVHELGASSLLYEDRIVIFREKGLDLASNFSSIGYIEFDENAIEAKTAELLSELIGFGLVKITAA